MKKTAKFLTLALALTAGSATAAQAADFKVGVDLVNTYVWRGTEINNSPNIQPAVSYTLKDSGIVIGAWGSAAATETASANPTRRQEVDLYATVPAGDFSFTVTNYYVNSATSKTFDFSNDGPNVVELSAAYAKDSLSLLAAINVAGSELAGAKSAKYAEAGYKVYDKDGYTAKAVVGVGDKDFYGDLSATSKIAVVNTGISVAKDRYTASFVYNPDTEKSSLVFMASF